LQRQTDPFKILLVEASAQVRQLKNFELLHVSQV